PARRSMTTQPGPTVNIPSSLVSGGDENRTTCVRTSRPKVATNGTQHIPPIGQAVPSAQRPTPVVDLPNSYSACPISFPTSTTADTSTSARPSWDCTSTSGSRLNLG